MNLKLYVFLAAISGGMFNPIYADDAYESPGNPDSLKPPQQEVAIDSKGVDIVMGSAQIAGGMHVSIGSGSSQLASSAAGYKIGGDNLAASMTSITVNQLQNSVNISDQRRYLLGLPVGEYYKVDVLGRSEVFRTDDGSYKNMKQTGGSLSCSGNLCTYTTNMGDVVTFNSNYSNEWDSSPSCSNTGSWAHEANYALATKVVKADGEILTYYYLSKTGYYASGCIPVGSSPKAFDMPSAVMSSLGWMIKYHYSSKTGPASAVVSQRSVMALNTAIEYCNPNSDSCTDMANTWPVSVSDLTASTSYNGNYTSSFTRATVKTKLPGTTKSSSDVFTSGSLLEYQTGEGHTSAEGVSVGTTTNLMSNTSYGPVNRWGNGLNKVAKITIAGEVFTYDYTSSSEVAGPDGTYNVDGGKLRLTSFTDNLGRKTSYQYSTVPVDRIMRVTRPDNTYTQYSYDTRGNITFIREYPDPAVSSTPLVTSATYWTCNTSTQKYCNKPKTITDANGNTTSFTYYAEHGGVKTVTKPSVSITINGTSSTVMPVTNYTYTGYKPLSYNGAGTWAAATQTIYRLTKVTQCRSASTCNGSAEEVVKTAHFDSNQNLLPAYEITRAGNSSVSLRTDFTYDIYGNMSQKSGPHANDESYYFYDLRQQLIGSISPDADGQGRVGTYNIYNADGKITSTKTGTLSGTTLSDLKNMSVDRTKSTTYSSVHGLPVKEVISGRDITSRTVQMSYDKNLRMECKALRVSGASSTDVCAVSSGVFGEDRITKFVYDETGALVETIGGFDSTVQRTDRENIYNSKGHLYQVKDGKGNTTQYTYDEYGRLKKTNFPSKTAAGSISSSDYVSLTYDRALVKTTRLRNGTTITFTYDSWGRPTRKTSPANGTYGSINETFAYDNFDNLTYHSNTSTGIASTTMEADFNALSWKKYETTPLGKVSYLYDAYGRKSRLTWPDGFYVTYDYGNSLLLQNIKQLGATGLVNYVYDGYSRKENVKRANGVTSQYGFDVISRVTSMTTNVGGSATADDYDVSFDYNPANQIVNRRSTFENAKYEYTRNAESATYTPNGLNQITNWSNTSISYDTNGNMKAIGSTSYTYNNDNLLVSAGGTALRYDAEKRLYKVGTTCFMYDGQDMIAETNCSGTILNRYIHGESVDDPVVWYVGSGTGTKRFYTEDYKGSVIGVTNSAGGSYAINSYDEYGIPANTNVGRFQFTGQVWLDEIDLYYYKARIYHPKLGRFLQTDPVGYEDQMNLYAYVGNDPINKVDPTGKFGVIGFAIGFGIELGDQLLTGKEVNLTKATVMGIAGALTGGITSLAKSSVTVGGKIVATTANKVAAGTLVSATAATSNAGAGAINDSIDGASSGQIVDNALENAIESVAPQVKVAGKFASKIGSKLADASGLGGNTSDVVSQASGAAAEKAISNACSTTQNKC